MKKKLKSLSGLLDSFVSFDGNFEHRSFGIEPVDLSSAGEIRSTLFIDQRILYELAMVEPADRTVKVKASGIIHLLVSNREDQRVIRGTRSAAITQKIVGTTLNDQWPLNDIGLLQ